MKRVIVLGGYGGFGARLSRRLSDDGWEVIVAGRNEAAAQALARSIANARPLVMDRNGDLAPFLHELQPFLLIDAAGPFQKSDHHVPRACIAAKVHYVDLADARDFVAGISELDELARAAGIAVISGSSSVPGLSGAVIADLARGMETVTAVEMSISASNQATAGASVANAILSYVGKPVRLWRGQRWQEKTGWQMLKREDYAVAGERMISRLVALADVPDHDILPVDLPGRPATLFRAGPEFSFQLLTLWALSWLVRWKWISSLSGLGRWLRPLRQLTAGLGSDRSAMKVIVKGIASSGPEIRSWTLIAEGGDGPEIPTLAAQLLARALRDGKLAPGARHAGGLLALDDFKALFAPLAIVEERRDEAYTPLYRRVMGERFTRLPIPLQQMHDIVGDGGAKGVAHVTRGRSIPARIVAACVGFPPAGEHDIHVSFSEEDGRETWIRDFGGHLFSSELSLKDGRTVERFGAMRFQFDLPSDERGLEMVMRKWSIWHIPLPLALAPRSHAREWAEGEDFLFDVPIALPLIGKVVHYSGRIRRI